MVMSFTLTPSVGIIASTVLPFQCQTFTDPLGFLLVLAIGAWTLHNKQISDSAAGKHIEWAAKLVRATLTHHCCAIVWKWVRLIPLSLGAYGFSTGVYCYSEPEP